MVARGEKSQLASIRAIQHRDAQGNPIGRSSRYLTFSQQLLIFWCQQSTPIDQTLHEADGRDLLIQFALSRQPLMAVTHVNLTSGVVRLPAFAVLLSLMLTIFFQTRMDPQVSIAGAAIIPQVRRILILYNLGLSPNFQRNIEKFASPCCAMINFQNLFSAPFKSRRRVTARLPFGDLPLGAFLGGRKRED